MEMEIAYKAIIIILRSNIIKVPNTNIIPIQIENNI